MSAMVFTIVKIATRRGKNKGRAAASAEFDGRDASARGRSAFFRAEGGNIQGLRAYGEPLVVGEDSDIDLCALPPEESRGEVHRVERSDDCRETFAGSAKYVLSELDDRYHIQQRIESLCRRGVELIVDMHLQPLALQYPPALDLEEFARRYLVSIADLLNSLIAIQ
ncbi:MAG TPA: hypothetical protein VMV90_08945 [Rectinemataceae bacterium]|nr:hypothetical protein [Rectinemataceae bacterium]